MSDSDLTSVVNGMSVKDPDFAWRYALFFTPRVGNTWLARLLKQTQQLGIPEEYPNPAFIPEATQSLSCTSQHGLLPMLVRKCQTTNGVFDIKVRSVDIDFFGEDLFFNGIGRDAAVFYLWRDNIVAQAVSLHRAVSTGRFHSTEQPVPNTPALHEPEQIAYWGDHLIAIENANLDLMRKHGLHARFPRYEDLFHSVAVTLNTFSYPLLGHGLDEFANQANIGMEKISDEWNLIAEQNFRHSMPAFVAETRDRRHIKA